MSALYGRYNAATACSKELRVDSTFLGFDFEVGLDSGWLELDFQLSVRWVVL